VKLIEALRNQYNRDYVSLMPTNLYGPGDNYDLETSHVLPAMIRKFHEAKENNHADVILWGTGTPKREFLYVDDMARACIHLMNIDKKKYDEHTSLMCGHINVGSGKDISIKELALIIKDVVGFKGNINFDPTKPDGVSRKFLDSKKINGFGFIPDVSLKDGLIKTYQYYVKSNENF